MLNKVMRTMAATVTGIVCIGLLAGCGEKSSGKVPFKFITAISDSERTAIIDEVLAQLKEKYPDVEFMNDSGEEYNNKAKMAFSSGDPYQLIFTDDLGIAPLVADGYLLEISAEIKERGWVDRQQDGVTDFYNTRTPGKQYSVGMNQAPVVVYYNKDIFQELNLEIPKTLEEFENCLKTAKDAGYIGAENCKDNINGWYIQSIVQNKAPYEEIMQWYYLEESKESVKAAFIEAEEIVKKWSDAGYFRDKYEGIEYGDVPSLFGQGNTAMSLDGNWFLYNYETTDVNVGIFAFPGVGTKDRQNVIINEVDAAFAISKDVNDTQKQVALDFIDIMLTPDIANRWLAVGSVPTLKEGIDTSGASPLTVELLAAIEPTLAGVYLDNVKSGFLDVFQAEMQLFMAGDQTAEEMWNHLDAFWHEE